MPYENQKVPLPGTVVWSVGENDRLRSQLALGNRLAFVLPESTLVNLLKDDSMHKACKLAEKNQGPQTVVCAISCRTKRDYRWSFNFCPSESLTPQFSLFDGRPDLRLLQGLILKERPATRHENILQFMEKLGVIQGLLEGDLSSNGNTQNAIVVNLRAWARARQNADEPLFSEPLVYARDEYLWPEE